MYIYSFSSLIFNGQNLNTVLDDNKILTLANGDRIPMTDNVKLMFEVEDLRNASPATVSRAGIIYVSDSDLDWEPILRCWLNRKPSHLSSIFSVLFSKYVGSCNGPKSFGHLFHFLNKCCKPVIQCSRVGMIEGCLHLLDGLLDICDLSPNSDELKLELERLFLYAITWALGGVLEIDCRIKFSNQLLSISDQLNGKGMPPVRGTTDTIFEYRINTDSMDWEKWTAPSWEYPSHIDEPDFSSMLVPTVETTRSSYILQQLHKQRRGVLMTGGSGTAKTSTALMFFETIASDTMRVKKMCFSSATSPSHFQVALEAELDKRGGKSFGPPGGKRMSLFMDDM